MKQNKSAISRFQDFLETEKGQTILNYLYSWGAAIVILGALFKLTHIEGADLMLFLGMGTEVLTFIVNGFERQTSAKETEAPVATGGPVIIGGTPSTMEIPDSLEPYIQNHDAFLLQNHGALTVGCNLMKALFIMEEVEFNAKICKNAMELGAVHEIPNDQLKKLMELRKKMNLPGRHPGIEYEETPAPANEELVALITKKVLEALGK